MAAAAVPIAIAGVQAFTAIKNAKDQAKAQAQQTAYQKQILQINTEFADKQGKDAIARGDADANQLNAKVNELVGTQKTAFAANGIDVSSGSAIKTQDETMRLGAQDALQIRNNAWREAYGFKVEALNNGIQGQLAAASSANSQKNTLITGGLQALGFVVSGAKAASGYINTSSPKPSTFIPTK